jgi:hypothetical protein
MTTIISGASVDEDGSFTNPHTSAFPLVVVRTGQFIMTPDTEAVFTYTADTRQTTTTPHPNLVALWPMNLSMTDLQNAGTLTGAVAGFKKNSPSLAVTTIGITTTINEAATSRLAWQVKGGLLRYYQDAGELLTSPPLSVQSVLIPNGAYFIVLYSYALASDTHKIIKPRLSRHQPTAYYPKSEQVADFGSTQSSVHVKIYEMSNIVGRGEPADANV